MAFGRVTVALAGDDTALVTRIIQAYRRAAETPLGSEDSFWLQDFARRKRDIHLALLGDDFEAVRALLRDPGESELFYGFDNLTKSLADRPEDPEHHAEGMLDQLAQLSEALGGRRARSPEHPVEGWDVEVLLAEIDDVLGVRVDFPNPFMGEFGLASSRGVISYRAVHAIYQAWRVRQLARGRVLEIGGGLGRTAYYAWRLGVRDYTLIDLPMTGVAQADFLGRSVDVELFGEATAGGVRILAPAAFLEQSDHYDLVLNVDSLTEMAAETAQAYCDAAAARGRLLLSINHEVGRFRARDMFKGALLSRAPYWLRRGYVEELSGRW